LLLLLLLLQSHMPLPKSDACNLLQLAMNCSSHETAATAVSRLPALLEQGFACRLLLTAVVRKHEPLLKQSSAWLADVFPCIDAVTLQTMLRILVLLDGHLDWVRDFVVYYKLGILPAAGKLDNPCVLELLHEPGKGCNTPDQALLYSLLDAQQTKSGDVWQLLQAAAKRGDWCATIQLLELPAVQELSSKDLVVLLHTAIKAQTGYKCGVVKQLCELPAVRSLPRSTVEDLLREAGECGHMASECMQPLRELLAAFA
jgi:hypothetical protein